MLVPLTKFEMYDCSVTGEADARPDKNAGNVTKCVCACVRVSFEGGGPVAGQR